MVPLCTRGDSDHGYVSERLMLHDAVSSLIYAPSCDSVTHWLRIADLYKLKHKRVVSCRLAILGARHSRATKYEPGLRLHLTEHQPKLGNLF